MPLHSINGLFLFRYTKGVTLIVMCIQVPGCQIWLTDCVHFVAACFACCHCKTIVTHYVHCGISLLINFCFALVFCQQDDQKVIKLIFAKFHERESQCYYQELKTRTQYLSSSSRLSSYPILIFSAAVFHSRVYDSWWWDFPQPLISLHAIVMLRSENKLCIQVQIEIRHII